MNNSPKRHPVSELIDPTPNPLIKKIGIASAIIAVSAGIYVTLPFLAVRNLPNTLLSNDVDRIENAVDFVSLRNNLKNDVKAEMLTKMHQDLKENPFAGFALAIAPSMVDNLVEAMVTPQGIAKMLADKKAPTENQLDYFNMGFISLSTFCVNMKSGNTLYFKFTGTGWVLYRVKINNKS